MSRPYDVTPFLRSIFNNDTPQFLYYKIETSPLPINPFSPVIHTFLLYLLFHFISLFSHFFTIMSHALVK